VKAPSEGDVIEIDLDHPPGHEQRGRRPGLVVSGFAVSGSILSHQMRALDWRARRAAVVDHLPRATLLAVRARLKVLLGL